MARYNKIYAGPFTEAKPQVKEKLAAEAILPGCLVVVASGKFELADASTTGKVYVAQDNYLTGKDVDTAWAADDTMIAMELLDEQLFNLRVPTGVNVAEDAALTINAAGKVALASTADLVIAHADEAYNNTSGADQLVRVRPAKGYLTAAA